MAEDGNYTVGASCKGFAGEKILTKRIGIRIPAVMVVRLSELTGEGTVMAFERNGAFRRKLVSMGIYPGAKVRVVRRGPFGSPIEVLVGSSLVAIRGRSARAVFVRVENGDEGENA